MEKINLETDEYKSLTDNQKRFLSVFPVKMCNVSQTCKAVNLSRWTYYRWRAECDIFKNASDEIIESLYDNLESVMFKKALIEENTTMLIWLSKTKMKDRGYVEQQEIKELETTPLPITVVEINKDNENDDFV